jgi:hypothetical protein
MATNAEKKTRIASAKALPGGGYGYETAARRYVNQGINKLGLKPSEKDALREKLIKQVAARMGAERGRTALRGKGIVAREAKARIKKAKNI